MRSLGERLVLAKIASAELPSPRKMDLSYQGHMLHACGSLDWSSKLMARAVAVSRQLEVFSAPGGHFDEASFERSPVLLRHATGLWGRRRDS